MSDQLMTLLRNYQAGIDGWNNEQPAHLTHEQEEQRWHRTVTAPLLAFNAAKPEATTREAAIAALDHVLNDPEAFDGRDDYPGEMMLWLCVKAAREFLDKMTRYLPPTHSA